MNNLELKSIIACNQSDGLMKQWAEKEIKKLDIIYRCKVDSVIVK